MKIIHKDKWGFWIFTRYSFILEDENEGLTEIVVDKKKWQRFCVGDYYDAHYGQFFKYDNSIEKQNDKQN